MSVLPPRTPVRVGEARETPSFLMIVTTALETVKVLADLDDLGGVTVLFVLATRAPLGTVLKVAGAVVGVPPATHCLRRRIGAGGD